MKRRYIVIFSLVFLLIPTYIILSLFIRESNTPINLRSLRTVEVISPNGAEYTFESGAEDGFAELFLDMVMEKRSVSIPGNDVDVTRCFKVNFVTDLFNTEYDFIFSSDPSECYVKQKQGVKVSYYKILSSQAKQFLSSEYSEGVYAASEIPKLTISGEQVGISKVNWNYKTVSGESKSAKEFVISNDKTTIGAVATDFVCNFSVKPDNIDVKISREDNGETIYIGKYSGISKISETQNHFVKIEIYANWNESLSKDYWGNITYVVYAKLHAPAYFYLSEPQINEGEFAIINAKNVIDISKLTCVCDGLDFSPVFFKDGEYYRAYVPIPLGTLEELENGNGRINFTLTSEETEQTLSLIVLERADANKTVYNIEQTSFTDLEICSNPYSVLYSRIESVIKLNTNFSTNYAIGRFFDGYSGTIRRTSFGTYIKYSGIQGTYRGTDCHYVGAKSEPIAAVNAGKVVFIGRFDYTGGLVVVDHGFGLLSWYWNIGEFAEGLTVGNVLKSGDPLGYNGGGGLTETLSGRKASVHVAVTIFGEPVDITPLTKRGLQIVDK